MISTIRIRAWHVIATLVFSITLAMGVFVLSATQSSTELRTAGVPLSSPYQEPIPAYSSYIGYGQVGFATTSPSPTTAARLAADFAPSTTVAIDVTAYQWYPSYGWYERSRRSGERVYIYPYSGAWSWTWTSTTGWLAMRTNTLVIGYRPLAVAT